MHHIARLGLIGRWGLVRQRTAAATSPTNPYPPATATTRARQADRSYTAGGGFMDARSVVLVSGASGLKAVSSVPSHSQSRPQVSH